MGGKVPSPEAIPPTLGDWAQLLWKAEDMLSKLQHTSLSF